MDFDERVKKFKQEALELQKKYGLMLMIDGCEVEGFMLYEATPGFTDITDKHSIAFWEWDEKPST